MVETRQFCTFFLDHYFFGIDVRQVQEVFRYHERSQVPLAPQVVSGLINLRGQIVTVLDLRRRLELNERADAKEPMNIVVRSCDGAVDLLVDEIGDVVDVTDDLFESTPETLEGIARELIVGAYKLEDQLLLILDIKKPWTLKAFLVMSSIHMMSTKPEPAIAWTDVNELTRTLRGDRDAESTSADCRRCRVGAATLNRRPLW